MPNTITEFLYSQLDKIPDFNGDCAEPATTWQFLPVRLYGDQFDTPSVDSNLLGMFYCRAKASQEKPSFIVWDVAVSESRAGPWQIVTDKQRAVLDLAK